MSHKRLKTDVNNNNNSVQLEENIDRIIAETPSRLRRSSTRQQATQKYKQAKNKQVNDKEKKNNNNRVASSKSLPACFSSIIPYLGSFIPISNSQVKGSVMQLLAGNSNTAVKFNKMSGIQEWFNCICLFVNIFGDSYLNLWNEQDYYMEEYGQTKKYVQFQWFAQPTQNENSPVIKRLLQHKNCDNKAILVHPDNETNEINPVITEIGQKRKIKTEEREENISCSPAVNNPILLFCRLLNEPYVYCGDLGYISHDFTNKPLKFVFRLNQSQHSKLKNSAPFQLLMDAVRTSNKVEKI